MTWSYRVVRAEGGGCRIAEVYTDGSDTMWTQEPCYPYGDDLDELRVDVHRMADALLKPVIDEATLRETTKTQTQDT